MQPAEGGVHQQGSRAHRPNCWLPAPHDARCACRLVAVAGKRDVEKRRASRLRPTLGHSAFVRGRHALKNEIEAAATGLVAQSVQRRVPGPSRGVAIGIEQVSGLMMMNSEVGDRRSTEDRKQPRPRCLRRNHHQVSSFTLRLKLRYGGFGRRPLRRGGLLSISPDDVAAEDVKRLQVNSPTSLAGACTTNCVK